MTSSFAILRKAATGGATQLFGAKLVTPSNKPVTNGRFTNGDSAGPLLYFSHAHLADQGFDLGLHPHDQIEIHTWIWAGASQHYDTAVKAWVPMGPGSMQVIRAGTGVQHAERASPDLRAFQIWFDPSHKELPAASYDIYDKHAFKPAHAGEGLPAVTPCVGAGGPIQSDVPGLLVEQIQAASSSSSTMLQAGEGRLGLAFMLDGTATLKGEAVLERDDALVVKGSSELELELAPGAHVFFMSFPNRAG